VTGSREAEVNYRVFQVIAPAHLAEVGFERRSHKFQITKCNKPSYPKEQYGFSIKSIYTSFILKNGRFKVCFYEIYIFLLLLENITMKCNIKEPFMKAT
jgi:hypothetical protein